MMIYSVKYSVQMKNDKLPHMYTAYVEASSPEKAKDKHAVWHVNTFGAVHKLEYIKVSMVTSVNFLIQ